jgi:acyl-[acyl carrier protein]--UDP-N-acetylglucosamine O-acyltransferase
LYNKIKQIETMTTKETFLSENRNEIIEIAQEQMRENGFEYVTLKEVLTMYKDTFDMTMTISEEMEYVIDRLKSKNNASYIVSAEKIKIESFKKQSINI